MDSRHGRRLAAEAVNYADLMMESDTSESDLSSENVSQIDQVDEDHQEVSDISIEAQSPVRQENAERQSENESDSMDSETSLSDENFYSVPSIDDVPSSVENRSLVENISDHSNNTDIEEEEEEHDDLKTSLANWITQNRVPHVHCDKLLKILNVYHPELPLCSRTLVGTPRESVAVEEMPPGKYFHIGIEVGVRKILSYLKIQELTSPVKIYVGIDGVNLTKSSLSQFWVIVGYLPQFKDSPPFVIGAYHGFAKPDDNNVFLQPLVEEALGLYEIGFEFLGRCIVVKISAFICDAPARAMITRTKGHTSREHGCSRFTGTGSNVGAPRTDQTFRQKLCEDHHHGRSILEDLEYLNMVLDIPLDPMHLVDLGAMRRILLFLFGLGQRGSIPNVTLNRPLIRAIDAFIISLRPYISRINFARQPRGSKELPRWKATELRLFLHYLGVVVFRQYLTPAYYEHFLLLHVAIKLLSCEPWCFEDNEYAHNLLTQFVESSNELYSEFFMSYNIHSLLHLSADSYRHGPIDSYSAYRFENHYGDMKRYLRKNDKPLQQLIKRLTEKDNLNFREPNANVLEDGRLNLSKRHFDGPLVPNFIGSQFKVAECGGMWKLNTLEPDNCVMLRDSRVIIVRNFVQSDNIQYIIGQEFRTQRDFYQQPVPSSVLHEYFVSNLSPIRSAWNMELIMYKCVKLPSSFENADSFVVFPLLMQ